MGLVLRNLYFVAAEQSELHLRPSRFMAPLSHEYLQLSVAFFLMKGICGQLQPWSSEDLKSLTPSAIHSRWKQLKAVSSVYTVLEHQDHDHVAVTHAMRLSLRGCCQGVVSHWRLKAHRNEHFNVSYLFCANCNNTTIFRVRITGTSLCPQ